MWLQELSIMMWQAMPKRSYYYVAVLIATLLCDNVAYAVGDISAADKEFNKRWPDRILLIASLDPDHDPKLLPKSQWMISFVVRDGKCRLIKGIKIKIHKKYSEVAEYEPWILAEDGKNYGVYLRGINLEAGEFDCVSNLKGYEQGGVVAFMPVNNPEGIPWRYPQAHFEGHLVAVVPVMRKQQVQVELRIDNLKQTLVCFSKSVADWKVGRISLQDVSFELDDQDRDGKPDITLILKGITLYKQILYLSSYAQSSQLVGYVASGGVPTKSTLLRYGTADPFVKCKE